MARIFAGRSGAVATTNHDCGASSGEGYFALGMGLGITSSSEVFLFINRSMAADGTPDARAIYVFLPNLTNFVQQTSMKVPGLQAQRSSSTSGPGFPVNSAGPQNDNTNEIVSLAGDVPVFPFEPHLGKRQPPLLMAVVVHQSDVGNGVIFTTEMYGATRKFRRFTGRTGLLRSRFQLGGQLDPLPGDALGVGVSGYRTAVLAETGLLHFWQLGDDADDSVGTAHGTAAGGPLHEPAGAAGGSSARPSSTATTTRSRSAGHPISCRCCRRGRSRRWSRSPRSAPGRTAWACSRQTGSRPRSR